MQRQGLRSLVLSALGRSTARGVGAAVVIEHCGTVVDVNASTPMQPNSTQKLFTVGSALLTLGHNRRFRTEVRRTGPVDADGALRGDLALVGGGDPFLSWGDMQLLGHEVAASGIRSVRGMLIGDASGHTKEGPPHGWGENFVPKWCGPISALSLETNGFRRDRTFLDDPTMAIVSHFRQALATAGVRVIGSNRVTREEIDGVVVATVASPTLAEIGQAILKRSDNLAAELVLRELGRAIGRPSTAGGLEVIARCRATLGIGSAGASFDGSGLSPINKDTPLQQVRWLMRLDHSSAGATFRSSLPLAGIDGTLKNRFRRTTAMGVVGAKTGTRPRHGSVNLAGCAQTSSGRRAWFSFMLTGARSNAAARESADAAVRAVVATPSWLS